MTFKALYGKGEMHRRKDLKSSVARRPTALAIDLSADGLSRDFANESRPFTKFVASDTAGDPTSRTALARLRKSNAQILSASLHSVLTKSVAALQKEAFDAAGKLALKALELDERCGLAWHILAIAREKLGDLGSALKCYQSAHDLLEDPEVVGADLGRLAYRLDMKDTAEVLFRRFLDANPDATEVANNLACVLRDRQAYEEAIDTLKPALAIAPTNSLLWNTLGTVLSEQGDRHTAMVFYNEALNNDPQFAKARYNLGNGKLFLGDLDGALVDCNAALAMRTTPDEAAMMRLSRSTIQLCRGQIAVGWDDYEARLDPHFADVTQFIIDRPGWTPGTSLADRSVLVIGEQGLGDEVLFANLLPDLLADIGPNGHLTLAVERRLVALFQRSFADVTIGAHATYRVNQQTVRLTPFVDKPQDIDLWAPLGSLLRQYRTSLDAFPKHQDRFLTTDPARVAYWREVLKKAPPGPKVGILWKSLKMTGARHAAFSPFEAWQQILQTPGISFINMQYGDSAEDLAHAKSQFGIEIWQPPGIDLKEDLDEVAALSCALDLTIGFANATTNISAACGGPVWMISVPGSWTRLGTDHMPWYPKAQVFVVDQVGDWQPVMQTIAQSLAAHFQI